MSEEPGEEKIESESSISSSRNRERKGCEVEWCENEARSNSAQFCEKHYYQIRRTGNILPKTESHRNCAQCGIETAGIRFCSHRCRTRFSRGRKESARKCKVCDVEINPNNRSDKVFCSTACKSKARYQENPEKFMVYSAIRRARKKGAEGEFTHEEWEAVVAWHDSTCLACGAKGTMTKDHIKPLSKGGSNYIWNIQPLCLTCNLKKHSKEIDYRSSEDIEYYYSVVNFLIERGTSP